MDKDIIDDLQSDWSQERPDLDPGPMGVILRIQALARILADQASAKLQEHDLEWWQYDVLSALRRQGEPFMLAASELAAAGMLTSGAMTNRIDRLEARRLVRREHDSQDRRRVLVRLTPSGLDLIEQATEARFDAAVAALEGMSEAKQKRLGDLLRELLLLQGSSAGVAVSSSGNDELGTASQAAVPVRS